MNNDLSLDVDVAVVGGGPGGLQAALTLGRARRDVVVFDAGPARNARAPHLQNFITRDGTPPAEFRRLGHQELARYPTVQRIDARVTAIEGEADAFVVVSDDGRRVRALRVFLALGVIDEPLPLPGIADIWGISSAQCPYCHGYEVRDQPLAIYTPSAMLLEHAGSLLGWSDNLTALTNGADFVDDAMRAQAKDAGVTLDERVIAHLDSVDGHLQQVVFVDGGTRPAAFLFAHPAQRQTPLVQGLIDSHGLKLDDNGSVAVDDFKRTNVAGLYAFGDCSTRMQTAVGAAASAMMAAAFPTEPTMRGVLPARRRAALRARAKTAG